MRPTRIRRSRLILAMLMAGLLVAVVTPPEPALAQAQFRAVLYIHPVDADIIDPFRPPAHIGASGNRGLEYGNPEDAAVVAAADGFVTFSGSVAGRGIITVHHPDNVRTTYSGLSFRWVAENAHVKQGELIGRATVGFHFGARSGRHYLDPQVLIDASSADVRARLIPPPE